MTPDQIAQANAELREKSPLEIVRWAIAQAGGLTERGTFRRLKILRKDKDGREVEMDAKTTDIVRPNDTIKVSQRLI